MQVIFALCNRDLCKIYPHGFLICCAASWKRCANPKYQFYSLGHKKKIEYEQER